MLKEIQNQSDFRSFFASMISRDTIIHAVLSIILAISAIFFPKLEKNMIRFQDIPNFDLCYTLEPNLSRRFKYFGGFFRDIDKSLLNCQLELDPADNDPKVLIIGTTGMIGMAVEEEVKRRDLKYIGIKSRIHLDVLNPTFGRFIAGSNISVVINCAQYNKLFLQAIKAAIPKKIPVISFVNYFEEYSDIEILVTNVFGPQNERRNSSFIPRNIYNCIIHNHTEQILQNTYVYSKDLAKYVVDLVVNKAFNDSALTPLLPEYTSDELFYIIGKLIPSCNIEIRNENPPAELYDKVQETYDFINKRINSTVIDPFITYVTTVSHQPHILERMQRALNYTSWVANFYETAAYEIIIIYAPMEEAPRFDQVIKIPEKLKKHVRVLEVHPQDTLKLMIDLNSSFPDFPLRNIGVKNARTGFVITGTSDITLPPGFFEIARCRCLAKHEWVRTIRAELANTTEQSMLHQMFQLYNDRTQFQFFINIPDPLWFDSIGMEASGDFEGGDKNMWELIHGYLQTGENFNVDTVLAFDWASNLVPQISVMLPFGYHMSHTKSSHKTRTVFLWEPNVYYRYMHGKATKFHKEYKRPQWGKFNFIHGNYTGWKLH